MVKRLALRLCDGSELFTRIIDGSRTVGKNLPNSRGIRHKKFMSKTVGPVVSMRILNMENEFESDEVQTLSKVVRTGGWGSTQIIIIPSA